MKDENKLTIKVDKWVWDEVIVPALKARRKETLNKLAKIRLILDACESGEIDTMPLPQRILYSKFSEEITGSPIPFETNLLTK